MSTTATIYIDPPPDSAYDLPPIPIPPQPAPRSVRRSARPSKRKKREPRVQAEERPLYIVDADDFCEGNTGLDVIDTIKDLNPRFRITLFFVPGRTSDRLREAMLDPSRSEWIDLVPHGWTHETSRECELWGYEDAEKAFEQYEQMGVTRGFKAPGWQISDATYYVAKRRGFWVADRQYNDERRPSGLNAYLFERDPVHRLHYHLGHLGGFNANEISGYVEQLAKLKGDFGFCRDHLE